MEERVYVYGYETKSGKNRYRLQWMDIAKGKWRSRTVGSDRKVADREAAKLEAQLDAGTYKHTDRIAWQDFVDDHVAKIVGDRDRVESKRTLEEFGKVCHPRGPKHVSYAMVERFVTHCRGKGNAPSTTNKKLRYVRAALNRAKKRGFLTDNPIDGGLFLAEEKKLPRIATEAEVEALLDAAFDLYGFRMWAFVKAALGTGARRGELLSLPWDRVHLDGDDAHVHFAKTKSHRDRAVPLGAELVAMFTKLKVQTLQDGGPFIGMNDHGRVWENIRKQAGIPDVTQHDLRRTFVTRLVRAGTPMPTVQALAGHASIKTTLTYYNHVSRDDMRDGIRNLERYAG